MRPALLFLLMFCMVCGSFSKSLGVVGATFPIREMSFLDFIALRLKKLTDSGALKAMESQWQERAERTADRPTPTGLPRATQKRTYHYDPSVTLTQAIFDERGRVLYPAGTRVNGLEERTEYAPCWLFFNGDDAPQVRWALHEMHRCKNPKLILTGGSVRDAEQALDAVIYFDQGARLSTRFQLNAVPARITRDNNRLQIDELVIKEHGDAL